MIDYSLPCPFVCSYLSSHVYSQIVAKWSKYINNKYLSSSTVRVFTGEVGDPDDDSPRPVLEVRMIFQVVHAHLTLVQNLWPIYQSIYFIYLFNFFLLLFTLNDYP